MAKVAKKKHTTNVLSGSITKPKNPKSKPLKRQQRIRRLQAISKAEAFGERVVKKVEGSRRRGGARRERRRGWEDVNAEAAEVGVGERGKAKRRVIPVKGEELAKEGWEDVRGKGEGMRNGEGGASSDEEEMGDEVDREIRMAGISAEVRNGDGNEAIGLVPGVAGEDEEEL
ncbi:carboxypeptidase S1 [Physcia stellaris]|nr:carboxypeptidase S1 [Physcia stellaris]